MKGNRVRSRSGFLRLLGSYGSGLQTSNYSVTFLFFPDQPTHFTEIKRTWETKHFRNCLNCDPTAMVTSSFSFAFPPFRSFLSVSFLSRVDKLNKLACSHCMGLHSSAGRALQRERRSQMNHNCLNCDSTASFDLHKDRSDCLLKAQERRMDQLLNRKL